MALMVTDMPINLEAGDSLSRSAGPIGRTWVFGLLMTAIFSILVGRLAQLQIVEHEPILAKVAGKMFGTMVERERRGRIVDSKGRLLALSVEAKSCAIDPQALLEAEGGDAEWTINRLAEILSLSEGEVKRIRAEMKKRRLVRNESGEYVEKPMRFAWVKRRLSESEWESLSSEIAAFRKASSEAWKSKRRLDREAGQYAARRDRAGEARALEAAKRSRISALEAEGRFAGLLFPPEHKRIYPQGRLASHILGCVDIDGSGMEGMEKRCEDFLKGTPLSKVVARDARRRPLLSLADAPRPNEGMTVELSIDSTAQAIVEEELAKSLEMLRKNNPAVTGSAIVMDPNNGDILALANYPNFDSNNINAFPDRISRNDAVYLYFEPGSTFKPFIVAAALQEKLIRLDEELDCGTYVMENGRRIKDIHPFGRMSILMGLVKSSNPAMVQVGLRLGPELMRSYVLSFGFGESTGSLMPGEKAGRVTSREKWSLYTMGSVPMGYEIGATPIQMASAYCAFANGGFLMRPRLVRRILDKDGGIAHVVEPETRRRVFSPEVGETMLAALRKVVTEGTGKRANIPEYRLAGKTGTANMVIVDHSTEWKQGLRGYSRKRHTANFVAIAPYDRPRVVIYVAIMETAKFGGELAAPIVGEMAKRLLAYLGVPPETAFRGGIDYAALFEDDERAMEEAFMEGDAMIEDGVDPRIWEDWVEDEEAVG